MAKRRSPRPAPPYHYRAAVTSVYDGDTCTVDLNLGLSITLHKQKIRLNRINAPELRGRSQRRGRAARDFLRGVIRKRKYSCKPSRIAKANTAVTSARFG